MAAGRVVLCFAMRRLYFSSALAMRIGMGWEIFSAGGSCSDFKRIHKEAERLKSPGSMMGRRAGLDIMDMLGKIGSRRGAK